MIIDIYGYYIIVLKVLEVWCNCQIVVFGSLLE